MKNFVYHSPTKIAFGEHQIEQLESLLKEQDVKHLLLVYGRTSIKKNGIYDHVKTVCKTLNIQLIEESNVSPNPDISSVRSGIEKAKDNDVDFILAAGGGSVADCAKAIAIGALLEGDIWDVYLFKTTPKDAIPLGVIITLAATGSETNGNSVISNRALKEKRSVAYQFCKPQFAIIDPTYTLTVNRHHTIAGSIDIIMHIFEQYFANTTHTETSDYMMMGILNSVIENTNKIINGEDSYQVRANISWASTITLNWILGVDKAGDWATHRLSYSVTKIFDTTHGYALAMLFTSWARVVLKHNPTTMERKLKLLGEKVFNETEPKKVIDAMDRLFESWGAVTNLKSSDYTFNEAMINDMCDHATALGTIGTVIDIDFDIAKEIYYESLK
jgi:hypothetical protein